MIKCLVNHISQLCPVDHQRSRFTHTQFLIFIIWSVQLKIKKLILFIMINEGNARISMKDTKISDIKGVVTK